MDKTGFKQIIEQYYGHPHLLYFKKISLRGTYAKF